MGVKYCEVGVCNREDPRKSVSSSCLLTISSNFTEKCRMLTSCHRWNPTEDWLHDAHCTSTADPLVWPHCVPNVVMQTLCHPPVTSDRCTAQGCLCILSARSRYASPSPITPHPMWPTCQVFPSLPHEVMSSCD